MKPLHCITVSVLSVALALPAFSQDTKTDKKTLPGSSKEDYRSDGLRKITTRFDHDFEIDMDEEALEANIESAVQNAMKGIEVALKNMDIKIDPIDLNLGNLNMDLRPIEVRTPNIDIDLKPIDIDIHTPRFHTDKRMIKDSMRNKSGKKENEKSKGLKKLN